MKNKGKDEFLEAAKAALDYYKRAGETAWKSGATGLPGVASGLLEGIESGEDYKARIEKPFIVKGEEKEEGGTEVPFGFGETAEQFSERAGKPFTDLGEKAAVRHGTLPPPETPEESERKLGEFTGKETHKDSSRSLATEASSWTGGGGWKYVHDAGNGIIRAKSPKTGKTYDVPKDRKAADGRNMYDAILTEARELGKIEENMV